ncbi:MAG: hypothetical protein AB1696_10335 [Planctomycetota bacterium]
MIVPLVKVTVCGLLKDKERVLAGLQEIGCLHIIPLRTEEGLRCEGAASAQSRDALKFLLACPQRRRQVTDPSRLDAAAVERQALDLQRRIQTLQDERDFLRGRINDLKPWGDFVFPPPEALGNLKLWFYAVPHGDMGKVRATDLVWDVVRRDRGLCYVVVASQEEPKGMPVERTRTGSKSLAELSHRLEEVEITLEDLQAERASLTRWCHLFARRLSYLEDRADLLAATRQTRDEDPIFALQAWAPREKVEELRAFARDMRLVLDVKAPDHRENPPALLRNPPALAGGEDLVSFYMTPSYWLWDPSTVVFFAFAIFFAMILSDAGYALILGLGLLARWKRMGRSDFGKRFRALLLAIVVASAVWGVLIGSYFGMTPSRGSLLSHLNVLDLNNFSQMMQLSILMGVAHLILGNAVTAWHARRSVQALAPVGWILLFIGAVVLWLGSGRTAWTRPGAAAIAVGGAAVLLFSHVEGPLWGRLLGGLHELTRLSGAFGDSLSYLRLFALGLAGASLAVTFNQLAGDLHEWVPGIGLLLAILLVIFGHSLNLLLGISGGVIHGLRLNFIEFFHWSISREGPPFQVFCRREK